jgi:hypothetical protein
VADWTHNSPRATQPAVRNPQDAVPRTLNKFGSSRSIADTALRAHKARDCRDRGMGEKLASSLLIQVDLGGSLAPRSARRPAQASYGVSRCLNQDKNEPLLGLLPDDCTQHRMMPLSLYHWRLVPCPRTLGHVDQEPLVEPEQHSQPSIALSLCRAENRSGADRDRLYAVQHLAGRRG